MTNPSIYCILLSSYRILSTSEKLKSELKNFEEEGFIFCPPVEWVVIEKRILIYNDAKICVGKKFGH